MNLFKVASDNPAATWDALMRTVEVPFASAVEAEKDRYIEEAAAAFLITLRLSDTGFEAHLGNMLSIADRYIGVAIRLGLHETLKGSKSLGPMLQRKDGWEGLWLYLLRKWVQEYGAQQARESAHTTRKDMQRIIDKALSAAEEFNPQQVAARLLKVRALSAWRAATIARTETHSAMMYAAEEGASKAARDNELTILKAWLPVQDERTRANHSAMSSHPAIPMDSDFMVGGIPMKRPGDPRGGADNCINCRCVLTFKAEE